jgi:hypothetical protein
LHLTKREGAVIVLFLSLANISVPVSGFQEALLLKGLKIVFKDHGNAPFDVI